MTGQFIFSGNVDRKDCRDIKDCKDPELSVKSLFVLAVLDFFLEPPRTSTHQPLAAIRASSPAFTSGHSSARML